MGLVDLDSSGQNIQIMEKAIPSYMIMTLITRSLMIVSEPSNSRQPPVSSNRTITSPNRGGISQSSKEFSGTATPSTKASKT